MTTREAIATKLTNGVLMRAGVAGQNAYRKARAAGLTIQQAIEAEGDASRAILLDALAEGPWTCATCKFWQDDPDDDAGGECANIESPLYRVMRASEREGWKEEWGCILHAPAPPTPGGPR